MPLVPKPRSEGMSDEERTRAGPPRDEQQQHQQRNRSARQRDPDERRPVPAWPEHHQPDVTTAKYT